MDRRTFLQLPVVLVTACDVGEPEEYLRSRGNGKPLLWSSVSVKIQDARCLGSVNTAISDLGNWN
jgi:hypothetical protein